jgi:hypothetical protein
MTFSRLPLNLSPKLAYALATRGVVLLVAWLGLSLDPLLSILIAEALANLVGYQADPGDVVVTVGEGSDARLSAETSVRLNDVVS